MEEAYYHTKDSVKEYIKLSQGIDGKQHIQKLKEYLPSKSSLLELGSGPGSDWEILVKDYKVVGSDNSQEFLLHLRSKFPSGEFLELDAATLDSTKSFDGIYSNKVLHHLTDEDLASSVARQFDLLNDKGVVCHSFWKGEGNEVFKGMFVNYHSAEGLKEFFTTHFDILLLESYEEFEAEDSLLLIARKKSSK